jgi:hypothetical protein
MNYLERYKNGEYEQVWKELQDLGDNVRSEPYYTQAQAVATETMRRVRRNCERIISRLHKLGYVFGTFPDGTRRSYTVKPLTLPSTRMRANCEQLESEAGPLPLSLIAFWQEVGAIDLVGMHPSWPVGLDPLVVDPPEGPLSDLYEESENVFVALAPDDLHKDNTSGGDPYGLQLPNSSADFMFMYERHDLFFVPYLRLAIVRWGGFPGLDGRDIQFEPLDSLLAELELF